jgi:molybdopterin molybdotransferase
MLAAQVASAGASAVSLGIGRDDRDSLASLIRQGLEEDILVLSGGVSAGVLDLVPGVLAEQNVQQVFHKVRLKPGKPLWFGVCERAGKQTLVFGLPGNPVSTLVCFELFVRAAIDKLSGRAQIGRLVIDARLANEHVHRGDRPAYLPARIEHHVGGRVVKLLDWHGSADLCGLADANALAIFPAGDHAYSTGDEITALLLDGAY